MQRMLTRRGLGLRGGRVDSNRRTPAIFHCEGADERCQERLAIAQKDLEAIDAVIKRARSVRLIFLSSNSLRIFSHNILVIPQPS
jgi:hypothetical protein